jgi:hypothetical protein
MSFHKKEAGEREKDWEEEEARSSEAIFIWGREREGERNKYWAKSNFQTMDNNKAKEMPRLTTTISRARDLATFFR